MIYRDASRLVSLLVLSVAVSFGYTAYTWTAWSLTRRLPAPASIRFLARNTVLVFVAHMPVYYLLEHALKARVPDYATRVAIEMVICLIGLAVVSELLHRAISLTAARAAVSRIVGFAPGAYSAIPRDGRRCGDGTGGVLLHHRARLPARPRAPVVLQCPAAECSGCGRRGARAVRRAQHRAREGRVAGHRQSGLPGAQCLFALAETGDPPELLGAVIYVRSPADTLTILHLAVSDDKVTKDNQNPLIVVRLVHRVRQLAQSIRGVKWVHVLYSRGGGFRIPIQPTGRHALTKGPEP